MFGLGGLEILVILVVALIVLGPDKLPKFMRSVGKSMGELRRASTEFQRTLNTELETSETQNNRQSPPDDAAAPSSLPETAAAEDGETPPATPPAPAPQENPAADRAARPHGAARPMPQGRARAVKPQLRRKSPPTSGKDTPEQS